MALVSCSNRDQAVTGTQRAKKETVSILRGTGFGSAKTPCRGLPSGVLQAPKTGEIPDFSQLAPACHPDRSAAAVRALASTADLN